MTPVHAEAGDRPEASARDESRQAHRARRARRIAAIYGIGALVVIAWDTHLGLSLPDRNMAQHWNAVWVGFDGMIVVMLALTAWRLAHRDRRVVAPAVATATLMFVDAWADITTSARRDLWQSILLAVVLEIPVGIVSLVVAHRALAALTDVTRPAPERG